MRRRRSGMPRMQGSETFLDLRRAMRSQNIDATPTDKPTDEQSEAGECDEQPSTAHDSDDSSQRPTHGSPLDRLWREYHDWDRAVRIPSRYNNFDTALGEEAARLAAEDEGIWGERAKDGTIKPVKTQQPKREYL